jgi:hypothetical protein
MVYVTRNRQDMMTGKKTDGGLYRVFICDENYETRPFAGAVTGNRDTRKCYKCGHVGHIARVCKESKKEEKTEVKKEIKSKGELKKAIRNKKEEKKQSAGIVEFGTAEEKKKQKSKAVAFLVELEVQNVTGNVFLYESPRKLEISDIELPCNQMTESSENLDSKTLDRGLYGGTNADVFAQISSASDTEIGDEVSVKAFSLKESVGI